MEDDITTQAEIDAPRVDLLCAAADVATRLQDLAQVYDRERTFPTDSFGLIREAGLLEAPRRLATEHEPPTTRLKMLSILRHIGRGDLSVGRLYEGHVNALHLIQTFGTPAQIERWSTEVTVLGLLFAVWNTEAGDGVRLVPQPDGSIRMEGSKTFASGAGNIQRPIVTGRLPDGGWQMCIVAMDEVETSIDPSWWQPPGMHASTSYKVDFTGVTLQPSDLLGAPDDYHRQPWFFGGAIRFAAVHLGGAEALFDTTRAFLRSLDRTGDPHQQARLGEAAIHIESGNLWLEGAARHVDIDTVQRPRDEADIQRSINYAHMTRLAVEEICLNLIRITERAVGARGMLHPEPMERIIRDLMLYLRQPAPDFAQTSAGKYVLESKASGYEVWNDV